MIEIYIHELAGESSEDLLLAYGIDVKKKKKNTANTAATINDKGEETSSLQPKACPHCSEPNKPTSKFCVNCQMVLTFDAFNDTIEEAQKTKKEFEQLKENQKRIEKTMSSVLKVIMGLSNTVEIHAPPNDDDDPETNKIEEMARKQLAKSHR
jgi:hypothetical protein